MESFCPICFKPIEYNPISKIVYQRTPQTWYTAFYSHSFDKNDKETVNFFKKVLNAWGVKLLMLEYDVRPLNWVSRVEQLINQSEFIFALVTKRHPIETKDERYWKGPDTVQDEITLSYKMNKPVLALVEKDVRVSGITPQITYYYHFERDELNPPLIEKEFINALKTHQINIDKRRGKTGFAKLLIVLGVLAYALGGDEDSEE